MRITRLHLTGWLTAAVVAAAGASCGDSTGPSGPAVAMVTLQPDSSVLGVASQLPLVATLRDANEKVLSGRQIFWASQDTTIAVVSQAGVVTARRIGITQIAASCEGQNAIAVVIVARNAVARVVVLPSPAQARVGETVQFAAQTLDGSGGNLTGRPVLWASSNQGVATIDAVSGRAIAHATGTTSISATSEGMRGTAVLTVSQAPAAPVTTVEVAPAHDTILVGDSRQLTATLRDAQGNILTGRAVVWTSANNAVATVSAGGLVTAVGRGTATVTALSEGKSGAATIVVVQVPVAVAHSVEIMPHDPKIKVAETVQLQATVFDQDHHPIPGAPVVWSVDNSAIATVSPSGLVRGIEKGDAKVRATSGSVVGEVHVQVSGTPAPVAHSVEIMPHDPKIQVAETVQLQATVFDQDHHPIPGAPVVWSVDNSAIATASASGLVHGIQKGDARVRATSGSVVGEVHVMVSETPAPVAHSVEIMPHDPKMKVAETVQLQATVFDQDHHPMPGVPVVWSVDNNAIATVSPSGLVRAIKKGDARVRATSGSIVGEVHVHVH